MGWYIVIKTIRGNRYYYKQTTWREGRQVKCQSIYVGPVDGTMRLGPLPAMGAGGRPAPWIPARERQGIVPEGLSEAAFINLLLTPQPGDTWTKGTSLRAKGTPEIPDPEVLELARRMGIAVVSDVSRDRTATPVYVGLQSTRWSQARDEDGTAHKPMVVMFDRGRFHDEGENSAGRLYTHTLLHELVHATKWWLIRADALNRFSRGAAAEELVAEIGACLIAQALGVQPEDIGSSRAYIDSWRNRLSLPEIKRAVHEARKAAALVLAFHSKGGWAQGLTPAEVAERIEDEGLAPLPLDLGKPKALVE